MPCIKIAAAHCNGSELQILLIYAPFKRKKPLSKLLVTFAT